MGLFYRRTQNELLARTAKAFSEKNIYKLELI